MKIPHGITARSTLWLAGAGFAVGLTASCGSMTGEDFNEQAMELARTIEEHCGERVGDNETTPTAYLVYKSEDLDACAQTCRFREQAANKCLRRLERMSNSCINVSLAVCRRVYVDCGPDFDHNRCDLGKCAVSSDPGWGGALLAMGLIVVARVRRRRWSVRSNVR